MHNDKSDADGPENQKINFLWPKINYFFFYTATFN